MTNALVVESWNLGRELAAGLATQFDALAPQLGAVDEIVVTHVDLAPAIRAELDARLGRAARWVALPATAGYYDHKNAGFAATTADVIAFLDGDCAPSTGWLAALLAPFPADARDAPLVVAGATSYAGPLARVANRLDFPYFARHGARVFGAGTTGSVKVRNFFANNVAFARAAFAGAGGYPTMRPMFHGQCQLLALRLAKRGIEIRYTPDARVTHAWPESARAWLATRLLRGADARTLLPYLASAFVPPAAPIVARLGALPALALLGARAIAGARDALRGTARVQNLGLVAGVTAIDAVGALAAPLVYRALHS